jgi:iron-sulfur cluster assembly protein
MLEIFKPVVLTERAANEVRKIMETKNIPKDYSLRLGIKGSGCGGASLMMGFDKQKEQDLTYETEGINVLVDKRHTLYLVGKQVDFYEGSDATGFMFD